MLSSYQYLGGVVDYVLAREEAPAVSEYERHKAAAVLFVNAVADRYKAYYPVASEPDKAVGQPVSVAEFVGPFFSFERRRLLVRGCTSKFLNQYFYAGDEEVPRNVVEPRHRSGSGFVTSAYADAFSDPPYGLPNASVVQVNELFLGIAAELFNGFEQPLHVYQWSTDWSNYFNTGHEWWGSFLWTVENLRRGFFVAVGASSTD